VKRTTFHVLRMYGDLLRRNVVASTVDASPLAHGDARVAAVDAIVTGDDAGTTVVLVNRHPSAMARCSVTIDGETLDDRVQVQVLDGPSADSYNSIERPDVVTPREEVWEAIGGSFAVPPHSVCVLTPLS
jgi:alpha-L-arabinofuranosidase